MFDLNPLKNLILTSTIGKRVYQDRFDRDRKDLLSAIGLIEATVKESMSAKKEAGLRKILKAYVSGLDLLLVNVEEFVFLFQPSKLSHLTEFNVYLAELKGFQKTLNDRPPKGDEEEDAEIVEAFYRLFPEQLRNVQRKKENVKFRKLPGWAPDPTPNESLEDELEHSGQRHLDKLESHLQGTYGNSFCALDDTPSSRWLLDGEEDPHPDLTGKKRRDLALGNLTDDELANACFLCDHRTSLQSMGYLTAVKERIRWLSRELEASQQKIRDLSGAPL